VHPIHCTTQEHFLIGVGSILLGTNTARYRTWDGMRAIDYLTSRSDIDPQRIGFTGCSGGGTVTSYVMALDDRVACAAPACYLTSFHRLSRRLDRRTPNRTSSAKSPSDSIILTMSSCGPLAPP
jgi:dipeptidyl aminopeptidase/acylaminoacyl peptidase